MAEPKPDSAEMDLRNQNMLEVLEALRGSILFVRTVHASHVPRKGFTCNGLILPRWFVKDNGEKLCESVVLLTSKAWDLTFSISRSREIPDVFFRPRGWKEFAVFNNRTEGDHLLFKLSGMSQFDVYIFSATGTAKTVASRKEALVKWSEASELPLKASERRQVEHLATEGRNESGNKLCGLVAKEEIREFPPDEQGLDAVEYYRDHVPREKQKSYPSFFKQLTPYCCRSGHKGVPSLEVPADFTRKHGGRLRTLVTLQGISEETWTCTVACSWGQDTRSKILRLYLKYGWREFWDANGLEVGQELEFTLVSDSCFVVGDTAT